MKKLVSLFISLTMVVFVFAQNNNQTNIQKVFRPQSKVFGSMDYSNVNLNPNTYLPVKASLFSEGFEGTTFPPTNWTKTNVDPTTAYQWIQTSANHQHGGTYCAGVHWDPTLAQQNEWLITPTLNLTALSTPMLNFWWSMSYYWGVTPNNNYDFKVKVSLDGGTNWNIIWTEDSAGVFTDFLYYKQSINLAAYDTCSNFKIAFQYIGSNGYNLYVDDVTVTDLPANNLEFSEIWPGYVTSIAPFLYDGYSQIPLGQSFPVTMLADLKNYGSATQTNIALHLKELGSGTTGVSANYPSLISMAHDTLTVDTFYTINTVGTHKIAMYVSDDSIPSYSYVDTFNVVVNSANNGIFSRDNNDYEGNRMWNGVATTGTSVNAFQFAHLFEITANTYAKSISVVVSVGTTVNAPIKAILYRGWGQTKTVVAESDYHFIQANEIATTFGVNPPAIEFFFNSASPLLTKDSVYFAAIQAFGGTDTVLVASNANFPQPNYTMYVYDTDNTWYYFTSYNKPSMIRLNTCATNPIGIVENGKNNAELYQNTPNPANNTTRISYELTKSEKVSLDIYDLTGRKVLSFNEGNKLAGVHNVDINLSSLNSGTYFYTLKTNDFTKTKKMIVR